MVMGRSPDNLVLVLWGVILAEAEEHPHSPGAGWLIALVACFLFYLQRLFIFTVHEITEKNMLMFFQSLPVFLGSNISVSSIAEELHTPLTKGTLSIKCYSSKWSIFFLNN